MEYLEHFDQKMKIVDESGYNFLTMQEISGFVYGCPVKDDGFKKIRNIDPIINENGDEISDKYLAVANFHTSGIRLRFSTEADNVIIKASLKRKYATQTTLISCSSGFDIYDGDPKTSNIVHRYVFAPVEPKSIFAEKITVNKNRFLQIYFPNFNSVSDLSIGVPKGYTLEKAPDHKYEKPIVFYGNSVTQGASASRSGNAFPNIINRRMNVDIVNYSYSAAARAEIAMADAIGTQSDACALIIDFNKNARGMKEFEDRYEPFYLRLRQYFPDIPVILIGDFHIGAYDKHISKVYEKYRKKDDLYFIRPLEMFKNMDRHSLTIDNIHYTDKGMFMMADKICSILSAKI